jgi:hypothetical protein
VARARRLHERWVHPQPGPAAHEHQPAYGALGDAAGPACLAAEQVGERHGAAHRMAHQDRVLHARGLQRLRDLGGVRGVVGVGLLD